MKHAKPQKELGVHDVCLQISREKRGEWEGN